MFRRYPSRSLAKSFIFSLFFLVTAGQVLAADTELVKPATPEAPPAIAKPQIDYDAINKLGFRLGVQAWTFREMNTYQTLDTLKALDIHYLELYPGQALSSEHPLKVGPGLPEDQIDALMAKAKECDVKLINIGVIGIPGKEADARKVFDFARKLGLETIVSEPSTDKATFDVIDKLAGEYGINVAMHDHPKPSTYWNPDTVLKVCEGRSPRLGSCSDVGHWYRSGLVPLECLQKLQGRVISLHLKDLDKKKSDIPWGEGEVNAKGLMAEVKKQGLKPVFSIEYESSRGTQLIANVAKCCENFGKFAEELTAQQQ